jgi:hypothetical protein
MGKTVRGGGMRMTEHEMTAGNGNGLYGEGRMRKTVRGGGNENGRTRNGSLPLTALISSKDIYHTLYIYLLFDKILSIHLNIAGVLTRGSYQLVN